MKIMVAMSGGVDSSSVAYMLKNEGYEIEGVYMKLHNSPEYHKNNIKKVEKIANFLGIKYHILDLQPQFNEKVYSPFIESYKKGETPNPCVLCNRNIKFGELIKFMKQKNFDKLATGHYISIKDGFICEAKDKSKDQSYFLANIKKENIPFLFFPLNSILKKDLKETASKIPILKEFSAQKESSEICFVDTTYIDVLKDHTTVNIPGDVINSTGKVIGKHKGYMQYTIGKRRGFEVFGALEPHYVTKIDPVKNEITVGTKENLQVNNFMIRDVNIFINEKEFDASVKIRYRSDKIPCKVKIFKDKTAEIILDKSVFAVAAGQMAALYDNEKLLGGGWII